MAIQRNSLVYLVIIILTALAIAGCSALKPVYVGEMPPLLSQDEVIRPYIKLGRVQVTRETYGSDYTMTPDIKEWGSNAVRMEAGKMGADAVMFLEITGGTTVYGILPSTEYRASGIAIKFK